MALSGDDALALAKAYARQTLEGAGAIKGQDGFSPVITENPDNTSDDYRLDIVTATDSFQTPNLKGESGKDGLPGKDGFTPTITENPQNTPDVYKLDITTADGSFTTPNLKGVDGLGGSGDSIDLSDYVKKEDLLTVPEEEITALFAGWEGEWHE